MNCKSNCHPNRRRASEPPNQPLYRLQLSPHCGEDLLVARTNFQPLALCKTCEVRKTGWHRFRAGPGTRYGPITREQLVLKSVPVEKKFFALALNHLDSGEKDVRNLAAALCVHFETFFTFLDKDGVEPTNNAADRALRCAVQWRKISFGSRSPQGEVAVARLINRARTSRPTNRRSSS